MPKLRKWLFPALAVAALIALWLLAPTAPDSRGVPIAYSQFKSLVQKRAIESVRLRGQLATGTFVRPQPVGPNNAEAKRFRTTVPSTGDPALLPALEKAGVRVEVSASEEGGVFWRLIVGLLPWVLIIGVYIWLWKGMFRNVAGWRPGRQRGYEIPRRPGDQGPEDQGNDHLRRRGRAGQRQARRCRARRLPE